VDCICISFLEQILLPKNTFIALLSEHNFKIGTKTAEQQNQAILVSVVQFFAQPVFVV